MIATVSTETVTVPSHPGLLHRFYYDIQTSPNYELTYLWFVQATLLVALSAVGIDTLFYACAWNLAGHFRIVQQRFAAVALCSTGRRRASARNDCGKMDVDDDVDDADNDDVGISAEFRQLIGYHGRIIDLAARLSNVYESIMLAQFLLSSLLMCMIAYQLTLVRSTQHNRCAIAHKTVIFSLAQPNQQLIPFVIYTTFLLAICFQCFVYCHGGATLQVDSESLAVAIYACGWQNERSVRVRRTVLFCLMRAQRPVLIATTFFTANLTTFSSVSDTDVRGDFVGVMISMNIIIRRLSALPDRILLCCNQCLAKEQWKNNK